MKNTTNTKKVRNINSQKENLWQTWSNITLGTHSVRKYLRMYVSSMLSERLPVSFS